jgi:hypothetical protein
MDGVIARTSNAGMASTLERWKEATGAAQTAA